MAVPPSPHPFLSKNREKASCTPSPERSGTETDYPSLPPVICYNPPHMDDVQTSKKKMPSKKEWRGFYSLILIQAQNAFNEKAAQFLLIPLGVWLAANSAVYGPDSWVNSLQYILACIFVLPYILFSPFVGWLADCFCKARIIQFMSFLQILVLGAMFLCYKYENIEMAVFWFCVFSVQATILSPAKRGW